MRQWYRFTLHGHDLQAPLEDERAVWLRAKGVVLVPCDRPADLDERLAPLIRYLLQNRIPQSC